MTDPAAADCRKHTLAAHYCISAVHADHNPNDLDTPLSHFAVVVSRLLPVIEIY